MAMSVDQLAPGAVILVPAGAALLQKRPYRLRITQVHPRSAERTADDTDHYVVGTVLTATGGPSMRTHPRHAWVDIAKCELITPAPAAPAATT